MNFPLFTICTREKANIDYV